MSTNKRTLYIFAGAGIVLMFVFMALFVRSRNEVMLILGVIMLNAAFQLIARLLINSICEGAFENGINSSSDWFRTTDLEERFYGFMGIKYLKKHLPKTERTDFSLNRQSPQNIIDAGCEIEAEHEIDILVSLLGILLSVPFGNLWIFVTVAVIAILYDLIYLSVQRYNRPRLERIQLKRRARFFEKMEREAKNAEQTEPQEESVVGGGEEKQ